MQKELKIPREYFKIAARFMKQLNLYHYWIQYLYDPKTTKDFYSDGVEYNVTDVFGQTCITSFLEDRGISFPYGYCTFEVFACYILKLYPNRKDLTNNLPSYNHNVVDYDEAKKIVSLRDAEFFYIKKC